MPQKTVMTPNDFRRMALKFSGATESSHMNHPDFRVGGKIFATLGFPSDEWAAVILNPEDQARVIQAEPNIFKPANGAWGRAGSTLILLKPARKKSITSALSAAWEKRSSPD